MIMSTIDYSSYSWFEREYAFQLDPVAWSPSNGLYWWRTNKIGLRRQATLDKARQVIELAKKHSPDAFVDNRIVRNAAHWQNQRVHAYEWAEGILRRHQNPKVHANGLKTERWKQEALDLIASKIRDMKQETEMVKINGVKTVKCVFDNTRLASEYLYLTDLDIEVGDYVVVNVEGSGMKVVKVVRVMDEIDFKATKWIVDKVDMEQWEYSKIRRAELVRMAKEKREYEKRQKELIRDLEVQMTNRREKLKEQLLDDMVKKDPEMQQLESMKKAAEEGKIGVIVVDIPIF